MHISSHCFHAPAREAKRQHCCHATRHVLQQVSISPALTLPITDTAKGQDCCHAIYMCTTRAQQEKTPKHRFSWTPMIASMAAPPPPDTLPFHLHEVELLLRGTAPPQRVRVVARAAERARDRQRPLRANAEHLEGGGERGSTHRSMDIRANNLFPTHVPKKGDKSGYHTLQHVRRKQNYPTLKSSSLSKKTRV